MLNTFKAHDVLYRELAGPNNESQQFKELNTDSIEKLDPIKRLAAKIRRFEDVCATGLSDLEKETKEIIELVSISRTDVTLLLSL